MLLLEVFSPPIPNKRPRATRKGAYITVYDPQKKEKSQMKWQLRSLYREMPLTVPLIVDLTFFLPIPKSTSKVRRHQMLINQIPPMKKPDLDNLEKFTLDCLNNIVYEDDSQIIELKSRKCYSDRPRTIIRIGTMEET